MLTTVIIPAFNHPDLLRRSLDSLVSQICTDFEVIVVDDGSECSLEHTVSPYCDCLNLKFYRTKNSGKPSVPRNYAASIAKTEYISFLDSDDFYHPYYISKVNDFLSMSKLSYDLVHTSGFLSAFGDPKPIKRFSSTYKSYSVSEMLSKGNQIVLSSVTLNRRSFLELSGFSSTRWEDYHFYITMAQHRMKFAFIDLPLIFHSVDDRYSNKSKRNNQGLLTITKRLNDMNIKKDQFGIYPILLGEVAFLGIILYLFLIILFMRLLIFVSAIALS